MSLLTREDTLFVVIDFQEKLMPVMHDKELLEDKTVRLIKGMEALGIPKIVTQQYTRGIGETIPSVAEALGDFQPIDKTTFSCMLNEEFASQVKAAGKKNVVICGIEAHICVQQTALQLMEEGCRCIHRSRLHLIEKPQRQGMGCRENGKSRRHRHHI